MNVKNISIGTITYTAATFSLAVGWHVLLFEEMYLAFGYFEGEPNFALGFLTIVVQGVILSILFPMVRLAGTSVFRGLKFATIVGMFFWTSHVLAFVAKQPVPDVLQFVAMETLYLAFQFGIFGVVIGLIYREERST